MSRLCPDSVPGCWSHLSAAAASSAATARAFGAGCGGTGARCRLTEGPALHCPGGATETQAAPQTAERAPHLTRSSEPAAALRCGGGRRKGSSYPSESCGKEQVGRHACGGEASASPPAPKALRQAVSAHSPLVLACDGWVLRREAQKGSEPRRSRRDAGQAGNRP